jgi:hypothetical protein
MKSPKMLSILFLLVFVNVLLFSQDKSKYPEHPITSFNVNLGINFTGALKGSIAPGDVLGVDFEHHFKSSPFGVNLGFRRIVLGVKNDLKEVNFFITEVFGKISYRISQDPIYINAGYSAGNIYEYDGFLPGLTKRVHFLNIGSEYKIFIPEKLVVSLGLNYKLTNIYDLEFGTLNTLELVFRFGKN